MCWQSISISEDCDLAFGGPPMILPAEKLSCLQLSYAYQPQSNACRGQLDNWRACQAAKGVFVDQGRWEISGE